MPLVKSTLKASIKAIYADFQGKDLTGDEAADAFADKLATAVDTYIKTVTVTTVTTAPAGTWIAVIS
jgi:hypothetical protein